MYISTGSQQISAAYSNTCTVKLIITVRQTRNNLSQGDHSPDNVKSMTIP